MIVQIALGLIVVVGIFALFYESRQRENEDIFAMRRAVLNWRYRRPHRQ